LHGGMSKPRERVALATIAELHGETEDNVLLVKVVEASKRVVDPLSHPALSV
jgi:hypothetical protein